MQVDCLALYICKYYSIINTQTNNIKYVTVYFSMAAQLSEVYVQISVSKS